MRRANIWISLHLSKQDSRRSSNTTSPRGSTQLHFQLNATSMLTCAQQHDVLLFSRFDVHYVHPSLPLFTMDRSFVCHWVLVQQTFICRRLIEVEELRMTTQVHLFFFFRCDQKKLFTFKLQLELNAKLLPSVSGETTLPMDPNLSFLFRSVSCDV